MSAHLKQLCHIHLPGNKEDSPAEHLKKNGEMVRRQPSEP